MKKLFNIIICTAALYVASACVHYTPEHNVVMAENEGVLCVAIDVEDTRATISADDPFSLKIYRYTATDKELVRKYTALDQIPQYIWLLQDNYCAVVQVGDKSTTASFDKKLYTGSKDFTITPGQIAKIDIECMMVNIPAAVEYDSSVVNHFTQEYYTYISAADEFDIQAATATTSKVPTLKYTDNATGYFIMPEGCTTLSWYFCGNDGTETITQSGKIENVEPQKLYTLKFKYSKDAPGSLVFTATVETNPEHRQDKVPFSPDPTVKGVGFDVNELYNYTSGTRTYNISALDTITQLNITIGNTTYNLLDGSYNGVATTQVSAKEYTVALSEPFFNQFNGGIAKFAFRISDASGGVGYQEVSYGIEGAMSVEAYDLWFNTADFAAMAFNQSSNIQIGYRVAGTSSWSMLTASQGSTTNVYKASATDISAGVTYEYALFNGDIVGNILTFTTPAGAQIPEADFENWSVHSDEAVCPALDPNNATWDTGNHATAGLVGKQLTVSSTDTRPGSTGSKSAYMASIKATVMNIGKFAAGNLFVGRFVQVAGMGGIVEFGKEFNFNARPKAVRCWIKNNQGTINEGSHATGTDLAKIYCCFTDRKYTVNTNNESTLFIPSLSTEGVIATATWQSTDSNSSWTQIEIPITYNDSITTKPTHLVLTFTCSGYGDYFTGSTDSYMYVDDVELVY